MEIIFNSNNTINILNTTKAELESLLKFCSTNDIIKAAEKKTVATTEKNNSQTGMSTPAIARQIGIRHQTINWRIDRYGIKPVRVDGNHKFYDIEEIKRNLKEHPLDKTRVKKTPFAQWSTEQRTKVKAKGKDVGKTFSEVFRVMSKDYGIVWDQVKKDFFATNQRSANSTVELCYFLQYEQKHSESEHYENIFENQLDKLLA